MYSCGYLKLHPYRDLFIILFSYRFLLMQQERKSAQERNVNNNRRNDKSGVSYHVTQIQDRTPGKCSQQDYQKRPIKRFIYFWMLERQNGYPRHHSGNHSKERSGNCPIQQSTHALPLSLNQHQTWKRNLPNAISSAQIGRTYVRASSMLKTCQIASIRPRNYLI